MELIKPEELVASKEKFRIEHINQKLKEAASKGQYSESIKLLPGEPAELSIQGFYVCEDTYSYPGYYIVSWLKKA
jgi:hypothetical protein